MAVPESDTPKSIIAERIMEDIKNKIYNPMNDVLFKFIFGSDERKLVTIINADLIKIWNSISLKFQSSKRSP